MSLQRGELAFDYSALLGKPYSYAPKTNMDLLERACLASLNPNMEIVVTKPSRLHRDMYPNKNHKQSWRLTGCSPMKILAAKLAFNHPRILDRLTVIDGIGAVTRVSLSRYEINAMIKNPFIPFSTLIDRVIERTVLYLRENAECYYIKSACMLRGDDDVFKHTRYEYTLDRALTTTYTDAAMSIMDKSDVYAPLCHIHENNYHDVMRIIFDSAAGLYAIKRYMKNNTSNANRGPIPKSIHPLSEKVH